MASLFVRRERKFKSSAFGVRALILFLAGSFFVFSFSVVVSTNEDGFKGVSYFRVAPVSLDVVNELKFENDLLKQVICKELGRMCE